MLIISYSQIVIVLQDIKSVRAINDKLMEVCELYA